MGTAKKTLHRAWNQLTPQEGQVMRYIAGGQRMRQVSVTMGISVNTVKWHLKNIYSKLGAADREEAVVLYQHSARVAE